MSIAELIVSFSIIGIGMLLGGAVYESVVLAPNHRTNVPESLHHLRQFLTVTTPANYFRFISPGTILMLLISVIVCWNFGPARWWMIGSFAAQVISDTITYLYHYPRNKILFIDPLTEDSALLQRLSKEWDKGNRVRIFLISVSIVSALCGLMTLVQNTAG